MVTVKIGDLVDIMDGGLVYTRYTELANIMGLSNFKESYDIESNDYAMQEHEGCIGCVIATEKHPLSDDIVLGVDLGDRDILISYKGVMLRPTDGLSK